MFRLLLMTVITGIAIFTGGVCFFSGQESTLLQTATAPQTDRRGMPAIYEGFIERWNRAVAQELQRELAVAERLPANTERERAKKEQTLERLKRRLSIKDHIGEYPVADLPAGLNWQNGGNEPEIGDPRAVKGGQVSQWISTPFPATLRAFGPGSDTFFNYSAIDNVWMPLVSLHPETKRPIPALADRWAVSADGRTVYYHLDEVATYSDGRPVKVQDFLLNICLRTADAAKDPYWVSFFRDRYDRIAVYGDNVIALSLPQAGPLQAYMACVRFHPAHPGFYHDFNELFLERYQWKPAPNTGAYVVVPGKIRMGERISLARVKNWWARDKKYYRYTCNVDVIEHVFMSLENKAIEMFRRAEIDMMTVRKPELWESKLELPEVHNGYIVKYSLRADYACPPYGIYLNCSDKTVAQTDVRLGLAHALNMPLVIESVFRGKMKRLGSYMEGYGDLTLPLTAPDYDRQKAVDFFKRAGYAQRGRDGILTNAKGEKLVIELCYADVSAMMSNVCALLRQEALKCGVDLRLNALNYNVCSRRVFEKRYQAVLWSWPLETPFPRLYDTFASALAYDGKGQPVGNTNNIMAVADPELDAALDAERAAPDYATLKDALHRAQRRIHELNCWVPGWREPYTHLACWQWIRWPQSPTRFCPPSIYNPAESHLYWVDKELKEKTLSAKRKGLTLPEKDVVIEGN